MDSRDQREVSFIGNEIPEIRLWEVLEDQHAEVTPEDIVAKISQMPSDDRHMLTIEKIHYNQWGRITKLMLTSGDVVSMETAIALADQNALAGFSTGRTRSGGKVLKSHPSLDWGSNLHSKPQF